MYQIAITIKDDRLTPTWHTHYKRRAHVDLRTTRYSQDFTTLPTNCKPTTYKSKTAAEKVVAKLRDACDRIAESVSLEFDIDRTFTIEVEHVDL